MRRSVLGLTVLALGLLAVVGVGIGAVVSRDAGTSRTVARRLPVAVSPTTSAPTALPTASVSPPAASSSLPPTSDAGAGAGVAAPAPPTAVLGLQQHRAPGTASLPYTGPAPVGPAAAVGSLLLAAGTWLCLAPAGNPRNASHSTATRWSRPFTGSST